MDRQISIRPHLCLASLLLAIALVGCSSESDTGDRKDSENQPVRDAGDDLGKPGYDIAFHQEDTTSARDADEVSEPPQTYPMEVLVMFMDTNAEFATPVDIELNGKVYEYRGREQDDPIWNSAFRNARGQVFEIDGPLTDIRFDPDQLIVEGLNNHGFGHFNYRVQQRHGDTDLSSLSSDRDSIDFWGDAHEGREVHWARNGFDDTFSPNPTFYELDVPPEWSESAKIAIFVAGHGRHHPAFGEDEHPVNPEPQECAESFRECAGECVNLDEDPRYCGNCTTSCGNDEICAGGNCVVDPAHVVTEILVLFFSRPADVRLNNRWYSFSGRLANDPNWSVKIGDARGEVIYLTEPLDRLELAHEQLIVEGLNLFGYGWTHYKIQRRDQATDFYNLESQTNWKHADGAGRLIGRVGWNDTIDPNPEFYIFDVPTHYTDSGKMALFVAGQGQHHPTFAEDCHPETANDPCLVTD